MPTAAIMAFIAASIITLYFWIQELIKENRNKRKIIILLILFLVLLGAGLYDILDKNWTDRERHDTVVTTVVTSKDSVIEAIDSTRIAVIDSMKAVWDSIKLGNNSIKDKIDNIPKEENNPHLDLCNHVYTRANPSLSELKGDNAKYHISICNGGKDVAVNLVDIMAIVTYYNGIPDFNIDRRRRTNPLLEIAPNKAGSVLTYDLKIPQIRSEGVEYFFYLKISYTKRNKKQKLYLRKIFKFDINNKLKNVLLEDYTKVSNDLIKQKIW